MKKFILFAVFALLFVGFVVALGEAEGKSPPGVEIEAQAVSIQAPVYSVSIETIRSVSVGQLYTIHKTEAAVVRRHDWRLWSIYAKEVKSLYAYGHLLYETKVQESGSACEQLAINSRAFKTEYG